MYEATSNHFWMQGLYSHPPYHDHNASMLIGILKIFRKNS